ncbi:MAG TPA: 50S ribosomal protein L24 [Smithellaceae bacterium]|jgi:large subunit ribosomal protein L24|nr:50S ribosomal protein L24 [Syntrophaceae bacterium]MDX9815540.1 50S ribosomal protein L24 [Smithellaceae bacterium]NMD05495.1 50S ribosomal protein L24 [Deltaproteobacteria bacterium]OPZ54187.1 MAG: 50S ribosomal protein L24 [Deltaproteobacteria bacterium ADurb.BinA014]MBP8608495.1 50S ribosomal protein L24 [Syntrophaceae bacterium]
MGLSKFKKGDMVKIISGKDKGKTGKVLKTIPDKDRLVIEKINLIKKHKRPDQKSKGGILEKEGSVHVSQVGLLCGKCNTAVRIRNKKLEDGNKVRICAKCGDVINVG